MLEPEKLIIAVARLAGHVGQLADSVADLHEVVDAENAHAAAMVDPGSRDVGVHNPLDRPRVIESAVIYDQLGDVIRAAKLVLKMAEDARDSVDDARRVNRNAS